MSDAEIKAFVAERDAMLLKGDVDEMIAFHAKHNPGMNLFSTVAKALYTVWQERVKRGNPTPWDKLNATTKEVLFEKACGHIAIYDALRAYDAAHNTGATEPSASEQPAQDRYPLEEAPGNTGAGAPATAAEPGAAAAQRAEDVTDEMVREFEMTYLVTLYPERCDFAGTPAGSLHFEAFRAGIKSALAAKGEKA